MLIKVQVTETLQRIVEVEACCKENAFENVNNQYQADRIVLDAEDFTGVEFEVIK